MATYRLDSLATLARQLQFTPASTRSAQLANAEALLLELDDARAYPLDFVLYRITGFRPKATVQDEMLTGIALQHDLGLLVENVSDTLSLQAASSDEPVLQIDDVSARFDVTSKTIQRWRRKGLAARRFTFPDGKRRVGFLLSSVERFISRQSNEHATSPGTKTSVDDLVRIARRLVTRGCAEGELTRRIARDTGRSPLAVLHLLRKHDADSPGQAVLSDLLPDLPDATGRKVVRAFDRGRSLRSIARKVRRPRSTVLDVLVQERARKLATQRVTFIDDSIYDEPEAEMMLRQMLTADTIEAQPTAEQRRVPRDLPPYLAELYRTPLLSPSKERAAFLMLHFRKRQYALARRELDTQWARWRDLQKLDRLWARVVAAKNFIVQANLRLVVSIARRHVRPGIDLMDLVSDGNLVLMRSAETFDVHKGFRFSTYATLALMKGFARSVPQMLNRTGVTAGEFLEELPDVSADRPEFLAMQGELSSLLSRLEPDERRVVSAHFGLADRQSGEQTLDQVGRSLGLTRHRVRQLEQSAMSKLRDAVG